MFIGTRFFLTMRARLSSLEHGSNRTIIDCSLPAGPQSRASYRQSTATAIYSGSSPGDWIWPPGTSALPHAPDTPVDKRLGFIAHRRPPDDPCCGDRAGCRRNRMTASGFLAVATSARRARKCLGDANRGSDRAAPQRTWGQRTGGGFVDNEAVVLDAAPHGKYQRGFADPPAGKLAASTRAADTLGTNAAQARHLTLEKGARRACSTSSRRGTAHPPPAISPLSSHFGVTPPVSQEMLTRPAFHCAHGERGREPHLLRRLEFYILRHRI
jgi:hypothetical protein